MTVRKLLLPLIVVALLAIAPSASAASPWAHAGLTACKASPDVSQRYAVFGGTMRALPSAARMEVKIELQRRARGARAFTRVDADGLGVWNRSRMNRSSYTYVQRIENLGGGAAYRARVSFRWTSASGKSVAELTRTTPTCYQPAFRPDLRLVDIERTVAPGGGILYEVTIRNGSRIAAKGPDGFDVVIVVDGVPLPVQTVPGLAARELRVVEFSGPSCTRGSTLEATVDPDGRIDEAVETNNRRRLACPL